MSDATSISPTPLAAGRQAMTLTASWDRTEQPFNLFIPSAASGDPSVGDPAQDGRGRLRQRFLEGSNVDPVTELVNLIRIQRAFEFNSQSVQAADEVLRQLGSLRRF